MKVTELLARQHREVEALFAQIESANGQHKRGLVRDLASKLAAHMRIEEELVYPLAREIDPELTTEALEEHTVAAFELKRLAEVGLDHETAGAKLKTLEELVRHHVQEEEKGLLPELDRNLDRARNEGIGAQCESRFDTIVASGYGRELFAGSNGHRRGVVRLEQPRVRH